MVKRINYRGATILSNTRTGRAVILCPFTLNGTWGPYPTAAEAMREVRQWNLSEEKLHKHGCLRTVYA